MIPTLEITGGKILIGGEERFLFGGEIHYFRLDPATWDDRLHKLKRLGCNVVSFYIPWLIHEPAEGSFDFGGLGEERNNLRQWLERVSEHDLIAIARPGPHTYTELRNRGLPDWIFGRCPAAILDRSQAVVSYLDPSFLSFAKRWYERVAQVIEPFQQKHGGPVALVQVDNETLGLQRWNHTWDAADETLGLGKPDGRFVSFLRKRFNSIDDLNAEHGTAFSAFEKIQRADLSRENLEREVARFLTSDYAAEYFHELIGVLRAHGIDAPLLHNAFNPNGVLDVHRAARSSELRLTIDLYYTLMGTLDAKSAAYYLSLGSEMLREFGGEPLIASEFQSGDWFDDRPIYSPHLRIWALWSLIEGFQGLSFYMLAGGENRRGIGEYGAAHDWQSPIGPRGEVRDGYLALKYAIDHAQQRPELLASRKAADLSVGVLDFFDHFDRYDHRAYPIGRTNLADLAHLLASCSLQFRIVDLERRDVSEWPRELPMWVRIRGALSAEVQRKLLSFLSGGGRLLLQCVAGEASNCGTLLDTLGIAFDPPASADPAFDSLVLFRGREVCVHRGVRAIRSPGNGLFSTLGGEPAAIEMRFGQGQAVVFTFDFPWRFEAQREVVHELLRAAGGEISVLAERLKGVLRREHSGRQRAYLLNYHPVPVVEDVVILGRSFSAAVPPHRILEIDPDSGKRRLM